MKTTMYVCVLVATFSCEVFAMFTLYLYVFVNTCIFFHVVHRLREDESLGGERVRELQQ